MSEEGMIERVCWQYIKNMTFKERLQLIQKIAEISVQELIILEAEGKAKSP